MLAAGLLLTSPSPSALSQSDIAISSRPPRPYPTPPPFEENDITFVAPWNGEILGTGARRPTEEEWKRSELESVKLDRIPITPLGLERLNAHRRAHRRSPVFAEYYDALDLARDPEGSSRTSAISEPTAVTTAGSLPSGIDNSTLKFFPPIRSQGSLNSCAQFSTIYYALTHMTAMARDWDAKNGGDAYRFSPKWTYNMVNGGNNVGSSRYDGYAIAQKHGAPSWADFPYDTNFRAWSLNPTAWWNAIGFRAGTSGKVAAIDTATGLDQLKQLLVNGYVLNFDTYINSWIWGAAGNDPSTSADDAVAGKACVIQVNGTAGGHSMTIVGYNDALWLDINGNGVVESSEKGALRIANSWGTSWREAGYCWVSYQALRTRNPANTGEGLAWYDEATWITAKPSYTPRLIAQFTLNHSKRSQISITLGTSSTAAIAPSTTWAPTRVLANAGGAYAFDGNAAAVPGTFYLDFTDLAPTTPGAKRFHLGLRDSTSGDALTVSDFTLVDPIHGKAIAAATVPNNVDAVQAYAYVDYDVIAGANPPQAIATASSTNGDIPLVVNFDASASHDSDGSIVAVEWNFGDGSSSLGWTASHTYTQAGSFTATLTVTDNDGATDSASMVITTADPNVINAPSNLTAAASARTVSLTWTDNSNNETGFRVERALKPKSGNPVFVIVGSVGMNGIIYTDVVPSAGTYYYRVQAVQQAIGRVSDPSNTTSIRVR